MTSIGYDNADRVTSETLVGFHNRTGGTRNIVVEATTYDNASHPTTIIAGGWCGWPPASVEAATLVRTRLAMFNRHMNEVVAG